MSVGRHPQQIEMQLLSLQEDHFLDVKSVQIAPASLQKHFVAFANTDGGDLYIGIEDAKTQGERIRGYQKREDANSVLQLLMTNTQPSVDGIDYEFLDMGSKGLILHIRVPKSPLVHYTSANECYMRLNASTNRISGDAIMRLAYAKGSYNYEKVPVLSTTVAEIVSGNHLGQYMERINSQQDPIVFLKKQGLTSLQEGESTPNVACLLLFDEEPQASLSTRCAIKVYRLQTTDKEYKREHLQDMPVTIEGPIEGQIHSVIARVSNILENVTFVDENKLGKLHYPADALKEILVNAVIHRDYSINDDIHVRIYDNRIEVHSPGKLPGYIIRQNILEERYSRNPNIVRMLHKLPNPVNHDIGEGLNTAYNALRGAGLVAPTITELENAVVVTIEHRRIASLQDLILEYLETHGTISNKIVRGLSGEESENKVKKALQKLREQGLIEPIDPSVSVFKFEYRKVLNR